MKRHDTTQPSGSAVPDPPHTAIQARGIRMSYGRTEVLQGVDLTVLRGEVVAILGPNGAGKSTTIEILEGFRSRTGGDVRVLGVDPEHGDATWRARIGVVLQAWRDHERWTVDELLRHLAAFYGPYSTPERPRPCSVHEILTQVGLADRAERLVGTLSGGQRRRVDVAIALLGNPELLFLDEPTTGFDPAARHDFHGLVRRLAETGTTVLLTTHDLREAERVADRIIILDRGRVIAGGRPAELAERLAAHVEVRWGQDKRVHTRRVEDSTAFIRELLAEHGDQVRDLEVVRADLETVYLGLVRQETVPERIDPSQDAGKGAAR